MKYVVGDIHGEFDKLRRLVDFINFQDNAAEFIFIGDYLDKGPEVKKTLDFLLELKSSKPSVFLMGNHEYQWLNLLSERERLSDYLLKYGGRNTIHSIGEFEDVFEARDLLLSDYSELLNNLELYWMDEEYFVCHSGLSPEKYKMNLEVLAPEEFLFNRYDFISCTEKYKGRTVIFGHTGFYSPFYDGIKIGIDTSACYLKEQPLTAFCLDNRTFFDSKKEQYELLSLS